VYGGDWEREKGDETEGGGEEAKAKKYKRRQKRNSVYTSFRNFKSTVLFLCRSLALSEVVEHVEPRGQRLLELARLLGVGDNERVEVARAADLELGDPTRGLLDADGTGVLATGREEEVLDLVDLLRLLFFSGFGFGVGVCGTERRRGKKRKGLQKKVSNRRSPSVFFSIGGGRRRRRQGWKMPSPCRVPGAASVNSRASLPSVRRALCFWGEKKRA